MNNDCQCLYCFVGVAGFEPTTPCSQSRCANRTALHPECFFHKNFIFVGVAGFEPTTPCSKAGALTGLRYTPFYREVPFKSRCANRTALHPETSNGPLFFGQGKFTAFFRIANYGLTFLSNSSAKDTCLPMFYFNFARTFGLFRMPLSNRNQ